MVMMMWEQNSTLSIKWMIASLVAYMISEVLLTVSYIISPIAQYSAWFNQITWAFICVFAFLVLICYWELTYFRCWENQPCGGIIEVS
jgi:hypothetical protein